MFIVGDAQYNITGCIGFIFIFSIFGTLLHFSLTVYINAVLPGKYGIRKDPFYFLKVNFFVILKYLNMISKYIIVCFMFFFYIYNKKYFL